MKRPKVGDSYECGHCGKTFTRDTPEDEANKEAEEVFGVKNASERADMILVCDDCWKAFRGWAREDFGEQLPLPPLS